MPYISQVAVGKENPKYIWENWPTKDGTGIRDYTMDLRRDIYKL